MKKNDTSTNKSASPNIKSDDDLVNNIYKQKNVIHSTETLSKAQRKWLIWHKQLGHLNLKSIQQLSRNDFFPKEIANCDTPVCPYCQYGKGHKRSADKNIILTKYIKDPGDLIHMDQAVSILPGRALTASVKPKSLTYTTISIFVDSIRKKIFAEF